MRNSPYFRVRLFKANSWYDSLGVRSSTRTLKDNQVNILRHKAAPALKTARLLACCLLLFPLVGTVRRSGPNHRAQTLRTLAENSAPLNFHRNLLNQGSEFFRSGNYQRALEIFAFTRNSAISTGDLRMAARATGNAGGCRFALHQYRPVLTLFLEARRLAGQANDVSAPPRGRSRRGRCPAVGPCAYDPVRIVARQPALLGSLFCHRSRMNRESK